MSSGNFNLNKNKNDGILNKGYSGSVSDVVVSSERQTILFVWTLFNLILM